MGYWYCIGYIVLLQVFCNVLLLIINQFVIIFKEIFFVVIIGFFEVVKLGDVVFGNVEWNFVYVEVYSFVVLIYFVFVFVLFCYGVYFEWCLVVVECQEVILMFI